MNITKEEIQEQQQKIQEKIKASTSIEEIISLASLDYYYNQLKNMELEINEKCEKIEEENESKFLSIYDNIDKVVKGEYQYTNEDINELKWIAEENKEAEIAEKVKSQFSPIQDYWYECLESCLEEYIVDKDAPVLRKVVSIQLKLNKQYEDFSLIFQFAENEYFEEKEITKRFIQKGEDLIKTDCTPITWKEGKNLTKKTQKKKQKNKKTGQTRKITKEVEDKSFFQFFTSLEKTEQNQDDDDFLDKLDQHDHMAEILINDLIPYSIENFFAGEGIFDDLKQEEGDEEDFEDEDHDDDEDSEDKSKSRKKSKGKIKGGCCGGKHKKSDHGDKQEQKQEKPECKQQ